MRTAAGGLLAGTLAGSGAGAVGAAGAVLWILLITAVGRMGRPLGMADLEAAVTCLVGAVVVGALGGGFLGGGCGALLGVLLRFKGRDRRGRWMGLATLGAALLFGLLGSCLAGPFAAIGAVAGVLSGAVAGLLLGRRLASTAWPRRDRRLGQG
jgi:hypothetical protein